METKSREEVLAERMLRKKAKQSKKQNSGKKQVGESSQETTPQANEHQKNVDESCAKKNCNPVSENSRKKTTPKKPSAESTSSTGELDEKMANLKIPETKQTSSPISPKVPPKKDKVSKSLAGVNAPKDVAKPVDEETSSTKTETQGAEVAKSKAQLKAERRALQEAQRTLKALKKSNEETKSDSTKPEGTKPLVKKNKEDKVSKTNDPNQVKMVSHLYLNSSMKESDILKRSSSEIHQAVIKLGLQYQNKIIIGGNARVVAFLNVVKQVLTDYNCEHNFPREFEVALEHSVQYLRTCRPPSVSMTNAVKFLKLHLTQLPNNISTAEAQKKLLALIADYLYKIDLAGEAIFRTVYKKISQDDVILTFGYSSVIKRILKKTFESGIKFRLIIVDAEPLCEGKQLLKELAKKDLPCTYVKLSAASYIMKEATKVLLGAHALLANGYVMSRAGASQIALIASLYNVPVLVCCETHKFSERVQTDALVYNELGDRDPLPSKTNQSKSQNYMKSLTLMYDVTPSELVTAVVTEIAILPCTSVPVVLRVKPANLSFN